MELEVYNLPEIRNDRIAAGTIQNWNNLTTGRVIFVWPWKMVLVSVCYLPYPPKKTLLWSRHCLIGQSCCNMTSKWSINWLKEGSSGMNFFQPSIHLTNQKPHTFVRAFSFQVQTKIALTLTLLQQVSGQARL